MAAFVTTVFTSFFECDTCQKCFSDEEFLKLHVEVHLTKPFQHDIFSSDESFAKTVLLTDISDNYLEKCRMTVPIEKTDSSSFECDYIDKSGKKCLRRFGEKVAYEVHIKTHENLDGVQQIVCHLCKTYFGDHLELFTHMSNNHSNYETAILGFDENMTRCREVVHLRIHNGEAPYQCKQCDQTFTVLLKYRAHLKGHKKEKKAV
ncbi:hypothetical protein NQ314_014564 [Rhamnusium bicolor]|uniref:C2H2-type domain-containing protein n=1 Tax=Rhamnusium bicolor TaxID=1586634 RepID=A0AAV8X139_9CUCU|nr:hypothetical protein NQ314_014564 [Rhamnusium bicolor]